MVFVNNVLVHAHLVMKIIIHNVDNVFKYVKKDSEMLMVYVPVLQQLMLVEMDLILKMDNVQDV